MPKGSNIKKKSINKQRIRLNREPVSSIPEIDPSPVVTEGPGRPQGSVGLRKQLIAEHCGPNPSVTQLLLVDALMKLFDVRKRELSPRDLYSSLSSERGIIKLLHEMKNGRGGYDNNPANSFAGMDEEQIDEHRHLCSHLVWSPHEHLKDGTINYYAPDALIHVHKDDQIDYHPRRTTTNEVGPGCSLHGELKMPGEALNSPENTLTVG